MFPDETKVACRKLEVPSDRVYYKHEKRICFDALTETIRKVSSASFQLANPMRIIRNFEFPLKVLKVDDDE